MVGSEDMPQDEPVQSVDAPQEQPHDGTDALQELPPDSADAPQDQPVEDNPPQAEALEGILDDTGPNRGPLAPSCEADKHFFTNAWHRYQCSDVCQCGCAEIQIVSQPAVAKQLFHLVCSRFPWLLAVTALVSLPSRPGPISKTCACS